jgi:hypothetical protein
VVAPPTVNVDEFPEQIVGLVTVTVGTALTVTCVVCVPAHEAVEPVIVYIVVEIGFTVILVVVGPVLHV